MVKKFIVEISNTDYNFTCKAILFNRVHADSKHFSNILCTVTKHYIYTKKCQGKRLNKYALKCELKRVKATEKYVAIKNSNLEKHFLKWGNN